MRVIDREEFLAPLAHQALGGEEVFGRCFVAEFRIRGDVAQAINRARFLVCKSADQPAAFSRGYFASMSNHCVEMFAKQPDSWHFSLRLCAGAVLPTAPDRPHPARRSSG